MDPHRSLSLLFALALLAPAAVRAEPEEERALRITERCIDQRIADRLAARRIRRGAVDRLYVKQARHELSVLGGYYVSDLYSGTYTLGAAYTYHMTETTAVELGASFSHANADVVRAVEGDRGTVLDDDFAAVWIAESLLVWTPVYGKLRLGGTVARFDVHVDLGVGVVDAPTSRGAAGVAGLGWKLFLGEAAALRVDLRDHVFRQELLDERFLVNDLSLTLGLSLFLPTTN